MTINTSNLFDLGFQHDVGYPFIFLNYMGSHGLRFNLKSQTMSLFGFDSNEREDKFKPLFIYPYVFTNIEQVKLVIQSLKG